MAVQTVVRTIGTASRQYSTLQAWEDGAPVNLTTAAKYTCSTFSGAFTNGETVTGGTSGFTGKMIDSNGSTYMIISDATGAFTNGETLTGGTSLKTCVITTPATDTGVIWQGQAYNDSEFNSASSLLTVSGSTSSTTCYKQLTTASGQSFSDNPQRYATALRYNQANGVGILCSGFGTVAVIWQEANAQLSGMQIRCTGGSASYAVQVLSTGIYASSCIFESVNNLPVNSNNSGEFHNCLFVSDTAGAVLVDTNFKAYNCTMIAGGGNICQSGYGTAQLVNCALFSGSATSNVKSGTSTFTFTTCYSNGLSPPTGVTTVTFAAAKFTAVTGSSSTSDWRLQSGSVLIDAGTTDFTNAPTDIIGRTRVSGQFDIGCIEFQPYTTTVKTIGTASRDYSTLQAWEDAAPANLVFENTIWQGQAYNDTAFSSASPLLTISGSTTSATCYKELTTGPGQSFADNPNIQTTALAFNTANGVSVTITGVYVGAPINVSESYARLNKIQSRGTGTGNGGGAGVGFGGVGQWIDRCIFESSGTSFSSGVIGGGQGTVSNTLAVSKVARPHIIYQSNAGAVSYINVTAVTVSSVGASTDGYYNSYAANSHINCAYFNVTNSIAKYNGTASVTVQNCYTDGITDPSIPQFTKVAFASAGFQNTTNDFRITGTSVLVDAGVAAASAYATDIAGTQRPYARAYDVGCWEYNGGYVLPYSPDIPPTTWTAVPGPSYWSMVADPVISDTDYVKSPVLDGDQGPLVLSLRSPLAAGTWTWTVRAIMSGTARQVRVTMLDSLGAAVGVSSWQTLTNSFATYTLTVTSSATATSIKLEAQ